MHRDQSKHGGASVDQVEGRAGVRGAVEGEAELQEQRVFNVRRQSLLRIWLVAFAATCLFIKPRRAIGRDDATWCLKVRLQSG